MWFDIAAEPLFAFAGIWRPGEDSSSMAFLTCEPNEIVGLVHPKAMPVLLDPADFSRWLDDPRDPACQLARPFADERMKLATA